MTVITSKIIELEDGQKIHFECRDPYHHWYIHFNKGQVPEKLKGAYTDFNFARIDVEKYLAEKGRAKKPE